MFNPFLVFGLEKNASHQDIRTRYTQLLRQYHPDTAGESATHGSAIADLMEAYAVLKEPRMRALLLEAHRRGECFLSAQDFWRYAERGSVPQDIKRHTPETHTCSLTIAFHESIAGVCKKLCAPDFTVFVDIPPDTCDGAVLDVHHQRALDRVVHIRVTIFVVPDAHWDRDDPHLVCMVPVSIGEALSGVCLDVATPYESVSVSLTPYPWPVGGVRVPDKGLQLDHVTGDLIILPYIVPPPVESQLAQTIMQAQEGDPYDVRRDMGGLKK